MNDCDVEDITNEGQKRKKKLNSGRKGKTVERQLVKVLVERFGEGFSRSVGSGNRWGQVTNLPKHAQDTFSGDLVCPADFQWVFESKGGYDDVDLHLAITSGNATLDGFLKQVLDESKRCQRKPMLCWKKTRKPWLVFILRVHLPMLEFKNVLRYGDWAAVPLEELLKAPDLFWRDPNVLP